ncbi:MAG: hypothetical protein AB7V42_16635 [Thermoleophilia bacterium]
MSKFEAPQMVLNSRMLYFGWIPADPDAVAALVPDGLTPAESRAVFMNQYAVDSENQTSNFAPYSLTYIGPDLAGADAPDGVTPGRWWTGYFNSNADMREYAVERGVPATPGSTTLDLDDGTLVVTTTADDTPIIRTTVKVGAPGDVVARGQLRYFTKVEQDLVSGYYPYVATLFDPFEVVSLEFLEPSHPVYALRPADPLQIVWGFYSEDASFCYPGGEFVYTP